ncbi:MAG: hypothetical protein JNG85_03360 [Spirochaetaceae bacterium]|nr:hypothetical protein [Spirochaetaceae bacterium]
MMARVRELLRDILQISELKSTSPASMLAIGDMASEALALLAGGKDEADKRPSVAEIEAVRDGITQERVQGSDWWGGYKQALCDVLRGKLECTKPAEERTCATCALSREDYCESEVGCWGEDVPGWKPKEPRE